MVEKADLQNISLPDQRNYEVAYGLAFKLAGEKLSGQADLESQCRKSDSSCQTTGPIRTIKLSYLGRPYLVTLPEIDILPATSSLNPLPSTLALSDKILILHYLIRAQGTPLSRRMIAYQELPEGVVYFPSFFKRAVKPLIDYFGRSPELLLKVSGNLGGYRADYGDMAVTIPAFSRVPITLVIWKGDEEFPPNGNILFDSTVSDYLFAEDINVLCQTITWQLVKLLDKSR
jgi:hypothetical protein